MASKRQADEARVARIREMEEALNVAQDAADQLSEAIAAQVDAIDALQKLSAYYGSQDWYADREADERGKLPDDTARGVLSEDGPYEALVSAREAALAALEVATATLRAL